MEKINKIVMPMVSVCMITYNHEKFISQAIEGVLMQKCDFLVELVIGDDFSTDRTRSILREYAIKYPEKIKLLLHPYNLGPPETPGKNNFVVTLKECKGKYIALCEGDDYWTDPYKLQKQVDFLEKHPDYVICYHDAIIVDEKGNLIQNSKLPEHLKRDFSSEELIKGVMILTLSMCFRNVITSFPEEYYQVLNGDKFLTSLLGHYGKGKYMPEIKPAVYRKHEKSVWSSMDKALQIFENGRTRAWLCRYYRRIGEINYAEYFKAETIDHFRRFILMIREKGASQYKETLSHIFSDFHDIVDDHTELKLKDLLSSGLKSSRIEPIEFSVPEQLNNFFPLVPSFKNEYMSCPYLETAVAFYYDGLVYTCCYPSYIGDEGIIAELSMESFDPGKIVSRKREIIAKRMAGDHAGCATCPRFSKKRWRENWEINISHVNLNHLLACNLKCRHCGYVEKVGKHNPTNKEAIIQALIKLEESGLLLKSANFYVGNGEPSINSDMDYLLNFLLERGYYIVISSNGTVYKELYSRGIKEGRLKLILTPDAGTRESYMYIKGKDYFHRVWENIGRYSRETGGDVTVKIVLQEGNLKDAKPFIDLCEAARVKNVVVDIDLNIRNRIQESILTSAKEYFHYARKKNIRVTPGNHWPTEVIRMINGEPDDLTGGDARMGTISQPSLSSELYYKVIRLGSLDLFESDILKINWTLTRRCNYDCSYCRSHDNKAPFSKMENIKMVISGISSLKNDTIHVTLTGGEPTIDPNFFDTVGSLLELKGKTVKLTIISNLSQKTNFFTRFIDRFKDYTSSISFVASYHFEFANMERFLQNAKVLASGGCKVLIWLIAHPLRMNEVRRIYETAKSLNIANLTVSLKIVRDDKGSSGNPDKNYSKEDLDWIAKCYDERGENNAIPILIDFYDPATRSIYHRTYGANELLSLGLNRTKGMMCNAGLQMITIDDNGNVSPSVCMKGRSNLNIYKDPSAFEKIKGPLVCPFEACGCLADLQIPKYLKGMDEMSVIDYEMDLGKFNRIELTNALREKGWEHKESIYVPHFEYVLYVRNTQNPKISVIVISWRLHPDTLNNFQILERQRNLGFELIFVDNGGKPGEFDCLKPYVDTYVRLNKNTGAYLARNIGAVFAKAPILLFLEDDGLPDENLVKAHLDAHKKYDVIAVRGVYKPKTENPLNKMAEHYYLGNKPFPYPSNLEGNSSYRADVFYKVGGWDDEIIFGYGGRELALRLLMEDKDPKKQIYSPEPVIYHDFAHDETHLAKKFEKQEASLRRLKNKYPEWDIIFYVWEKFFMRDDLLILKNENSAKKDEKTYDDYLSDALLFYEQGNVNMAQASLGEFIKAVRESKRWCQM